MVQQIYPKKQMSRHLFNSIGKMAVRFVKTKDKLFLLAKATQELIPSKLGGPRTCERKTVSFSKDNWLNKEALW